MLVGFLYYGIRLFRLLQSNPIASQGRTSKLREVRLNKTRNFFFLLLKLFVGWWSYYYLCYFVCCQTNYVNVRFKTTFVCTNAFLCRLMFVPSLRHSTALEASWEYILAYFVIAEVRKRKFFFQLFLKIIFFRLFPLCLFYLYCVKCRPDILPMQLQLEQ